MGRPRGWILNRKPYEFALVQRGISRAELAQQAGISAQMLSDLASSKRAGASPRTANALAAILECPVELLFPEAAGFGPPGYALAVA